MKSKMPFSSVKNEAGLEHKPLELLRMDIEALDDLRSGISERVFLYVVDNEGQEVLSELANLKDAGERLRLRAVTFSPDGITPRSEFFRLVRCSDPLFWQRLGRTYLAATGQSNARFLRPFFDGKLDWLELLLGEATQLSLNAWPKSCRSCEALDAALIERLLLLEGFSSELLVRAAFEPAPGGVFGAPMEEVFLTLRGLKESVLAHRETLSAILGKSDYRVRVYALAMMKRCAIPASAFSDELVQLSLESSKKVRDLAQSIISNATEEVWPKLQEKISRGSVDEKFHAVHLLWKLRGESARDFLSKHIERERNEKVAAAIESNLKTAVSSASASIGVKLRPLPQAASDAPLSEETKRAWRETFQRVNAAIRDHNQTHSAVYLQAKEVPDEAVEESFRSMQSGTQKPVLECIFSISWQREANQALREFWQRPELHTIHLVRFLIHVGSLRLHDHRRITEIYGYWLENLFPFFRRTHPEVGLRELGAAFDLAGIDSTRLGRYYLHRFSEGPPLDLPDDSIWPYWAENLELIDEAFAPCTASGMDAYYHRYARRNAFHALATFPTPPENLRELLWKLSVGGKSERALAQRALQTAPDKVERLIATLAAREAEARFAAAEWLGRIGDRTALGPLLGALKKEKNELTKGAIISALELLGAAVEDFLDRKALLKEAEKGVAKGVPADLRWFPLDRLLAVHWADNRKVVSRTIIEWWLIQCFKLKNPEPGPILRRYCASLVPSEREALGQFILEAWIAEDTAPISQTEAEQRAQQAAQQTYQWSQGPYWPANSPKKSLQAFYNDLLPGFLEQPKGSAISSKGILAISAACAGAQAPPVVNQFLKRWYGMRVAQCRALLQMLAWIEHKSATQLLLAVSRRFRTKSIQEEAGRLAQVIAERKGWTVAELSDRTIPTAGLDEDGVLTLDFGPRQFTARLNEELELVLTDADGKQLKALPDPRKDDDEAKAADAKKLLSSAKKELKSVVSMQRDRLYEAMCTERTWTFEDWNLYLNHHPIVRHHCQRLVWAVVRDNTVVSMFRPLPDSTFTDEADEPKTLQLEDQIRLAHECHVTPEQSLAWRQHLSDYEVESLFEQFGRPALDRREERLQQEEIEDFRGHLLEAFKLRGRATKLGYTRGQAQDGGWFYDYNKRFPTLGLQATIEFSGNGLPEENRTVALTTMKFSKTVSSNDGAYGTGAAIALKEVPPVLLSECWNDLRQIAAEGSGYDPEWEKKCGL